MDNAEDNITITRRELYSALASVWLFFVISFSASLAPPLPIPANVVYLSIAFGAFVYYLLASKRARLSRKEMTASLALWVFLGFIGLATAVAGSLSH